MIIMKELEMLTVEEQQYNNYMYMQLYLYSKLKDIAGFRGHDHMVV